MGSGANDAYARALGSVIAKLERTGPLGMPDRDAVMALPFKVLTLSRHRHVVREGGPTDHCSILLSGYVHRYKITNTGARQIVSFHVPGDMLDLQHVLLKRADHSVQTITEAQIAIVSTEAIRRLAHEHQAIGEALWRDTLVEASIYREWILNVGRRSAKQRVAHVLCEFAARRESAGQGAPERFELPMSQEQLADATGLTAVHVNRMLTELGRDGTIARDRRQVEIIDWPRMRETADFDPAYLHIESDSDILHHSIKI